MKRAALRIALKETDRRMLNQSITHSCRADYRAHMESLVGKIEESDVVGDRTSVARLTKQLSGKKNNSIFSKPSRKSDGSPIIYIETAPEEWAKVLQNKFAPHEGPHPI